MALHWLPSFRPGAHSQPTTLSSSSSPSSTSPSPASPSSPTKDEPSNFPISPRSPCSLMSLPPELHLQIARQLVYPDALSLKHASRYFYHSVDTGIKLKVDWLVSRRRLHLDCPNDTRCDLGSDLRFCRGSVPLLMKRRREHVECESRPDLGCLIYNTRTCIHRRPPPTLHRWLRRRLTVETWWVLLALVPLLLSWLWFAELLFLQRAS